MNLVELVFFELAAIGNGEISSWSATLAAVLVHNVDDLLAVDDFAKDGVFAVEPGARDKRDEKL